MILPQEHADKNEAPSLQSKGPPRQEQEGSAEEPSRASHVGDRLAVLSIKGHPHQISGLARQEQEAPLLNVHPFLLCAMTVCRTECRRPTTFSLRTSPKDMNGKPQG